MKTTRIFESREREKETTKKMEQLRGRRKIRIRCLVPCLTMTTMMIEDREKIGRRGNNDNSPRQGIRRMVKDMQVEPLLPPIDLKKLMKKKEDENKNRREEEEERERKKRKEREDSERRRKDREEDEARKKRKEEEEERRKRKDEEEEERKREKKEDEERRRKKDDEEKRRKRDEEEKRRKEDDDRRKKKEDEEKEEEERRLRKERKRKEKEEKRRKEEDEKRKKDEEDKRRKEEENRRKREEDKKREIEEREREETVRKLEEERKKEAERLRKEEETRKREEEERRKKDEERKKKEDEERIKKEKEMRRENKREEEKRRLREEEKERKRREDDEKSRKETREKDKKGSLSLDNLSQSKLEALKEKEKERRKKENGFSDFKEDRPTSGSSYISNKKEWKEEKEKKSRKETDRIIKKEESSARSSPMSSKNSSRVATPIPPLPLPHSQPSTSTHQHAPSSSIDYSFPLCPSSSCLASALAPVGLSQLEQRGDYDGYTSYAKEKKHRGDAAQDRVIRFFHYMECCVYFALSASTIHPDRSSDRELTMAASVLKDTVDLIKHAMIIFEKENNGHLMTRAKILCLRTQAVLNYHMYFVRSNKYPRRADSLASLESQVVEIPRASPRKEENGGKKGEDKNAATPSSSYSSITSPSSNMVSMPMSLWKVKMSVASTLSHLETAHRLWNDSIKLVKNSEKHYFNTVDQLILQSFDWGCPLHVGSSLLHLSHFVNTTVSWMRLEYEGERSR
ncbi:hypothetical protein PFISCL1PPCAC_28650 [Pristionchus fissidentatus]|uniref:AF4/FMR2 family member lilli n=1 Tax=Pristionchus fissidentatus TaxID=1538716 RepID=A0AAV5X157_9BILA|nr:hypothetical protein PFISCL1PPCAC_28650 [Pristionchus fissidentatus]